MFNIKNDECKGKCMLQKIKSQEIYEEMSLVTWN